MRTNAPALPASSARCDIPVVDAAQLNASALTAYYSEPLLVRGGAASWPALRRWRRSIMLQTWGDLLVQLAPNGERVPLKGFSHHNSIGGEACARLKHSPARLKHSRVQRSPRASACDR